MFDLQKNFSKLTVSGNYGSSDTQVLISGNNLAAKIPNSGSGIFSVVWYNHTDYPAVYNDPNKEICRVTGFSGQYLYLDRGREYTTAALHSGANKTYKMISTPTARGFNNLYYFKNPEKTYFLFEDFLGPMASNKGWQADQSAGGGQQQPYLWNQQLGAWAAAAGTGLSSYRQFFYGTNTNNFVLGSGLLVFEGMLHVNQIPTPDNSVRVVFGLKNRQDSLAVEGVYFLLDSGSSYIQIVSEKNSILQVQTDTTIPATTGWHKYNIVVDRDATKADFYVDDVFGGSIDGSLLSIRRMRIEMAVWRKDVANPNPFPSGQVTGSMDYVLLYKEIQAKDDAYGITGYNYRIAF